MAKRSRTRRNGGGGRRRPKPVIRVSTLLVLVLTFLPPPVVGQGCALCRSTVATQPSSVADTLNLGILVLLVPPLAIMLTILLVTFRRDKESRLSWDSLDRSRYVSVYNAVGRRLWPFD